MRKFNVENMKSTTTPLAVHFKLTKKQKVESEEEMKEMELIPYSNIVGNLIYMMI